MGISFLDPWISYQLYPIPFDVEICTDTGKVESPMYTREEFIELPFKFLDSTSDVIPSRNLWSINELERSYLCSIIVTNETCKLLEKNTVKQ